MSEYREFLVKWPNFDRILALPHRGELTAETGDYGADLILEKDGTRTVVQAKRWKLPVGIEAVQQVIGAMQTDP